MAGVAGLSLTGKARSGEIGGRHDFLSMVVGAGLVGDGCRII